jgi:hypothetical protein
MPSVPEGVFTLKEPLSWEPITNRNAPREASTATPPFPLFESYTNLSSRTFDPGPTVRLLLSRKRRSAWPSLPVLIDSFASRKCACDTAGRFGFCRGGCSDSGLGVGDPRTQCKERYQRQYANPKSTECPRVCIHSTSPQEACTTIA